MIEKNRMEEGDDFQYFYFRAPIFMIISMTIITWIASQIKNLTNRHV